MPVLRRGRCLRHNQLVEHPPNLYHNQIEDEGKSACLQVGQIGEVGVEVQVAAASHIHHLDLIPYHAPDHDPRAGRRHHHPSHVPPVPAVSAPSVARVLPHPVAVLTRSICIVTLLVLQAHVASHLLTDLKIKKEGARNQSAANHQVVKLHLSLILCHHYHYHQNLPNLTVDKSVSSHPITITIIITTTITHLLILQLQELSAQAHLVEHQYYPAKLRIL